MVIRIRKDGTTVSVVTKIFLGYDFIAFWGMISVHLNEKHWALLIVSIKTKQVLYIDPYGASEKDKSRVLTKLNIFCKSRNLKMIKCFTK